MEKRIENLINSFSVLEIDIDFGIAALNQFLHEMELVKSGVTLSELGMSERRETSKPQDLGNGIRKAHLNGVMRLEDSISTKGVKSLVSELQSLDKDPDVNAIVLEVNSGGGEALAGAVLQSAISDLETPLYTYGHLICSAALRATLPSMGGVFLSSESAKIGSIGTMIQINKEMVEYLKENVDSLYSEESTHKNKGLRDYLQGDNAKLISSLNAETKIFKNQVLKYRSIPEDLQESTLNGDVFLASEAQTRGLIDGVYSEKELINHIVNDLNLDNKIIPNKIEIDMNISNIVQSINKVFGWNYTEEQSAELEAALATVSSMEELQAMAASVSELHSKNSELAEQVQTLETQTLQTLQTLETLEGVNAKIETLQSNVTSLSNLTAELANEPAIEGNSDAPEALQESANVFDAQGNLIILNDSKY